MIIYPLKFMGVPKGLKLEVFLIKKLASICLCSHIVLVFHFIYMLYLLGFYCRLLLQTFLPYWSNKNITRHRQGTVSKLLSCLPCNTWKLQCLQLAITFLDNSQQNTVLWSKHQLELIAAELLNQQEHFLSAMAFWRWHRTKCKSTLISFKLFLSVQEIS